MPGLETAAGRISPHSGAGRVGEGGRGGEDCSQKRTLMFAEIKEIFEMLDKNGNGSSLTKP